MRRTMRQLASASIIAVAALLGPAEATPAAAAWPGANGPIVFAAYIPGGEEASRGLGIFSAPPGAGREEISRLTALASDSDPQVSPDGQRVVFLRATAPQVPGRDTVAAIYTMAIDGSGLTQLTDGLHTDLDPTFSASGTSVYFARRTPGSGLDIYSVGLAGGAVRRITSDPAAERDPVASPQGRIIAYERRAGTRPTHIYTARLDGSRPHDATPGFEAEALDPDFSPDGGRIAFALPARGELMSTRPNGAGHRVLRPAQPADNTLLEPAYSPDGRSLVYAVVPDGGRSSLRRIDARSGRPLPGPLTQPHLAILESAWAPR